MQRKILHSLKQIPAKVYSILSVVLLVIVMYTAAVSLSLKEIIFPELAALAVGTWVLGNQRWLRRPWLICISPTLAALTGTVIVRFLPRYQVVDILLAFVVVSIELSIMRSHITPSISAGILPIFLKIDSIYYPLAVGGLTAIIVFSRQGLLLINKEKLTVPQGTPTYRSESMGVNKNFPEWLGIFTGVSLITLVAFFIHWQFIVAPPLIVTFVEVIQHREGISGQRFKLVSLLGCAAIWGTFCMIVLHNMGHLPLVIVAGCSVLGVLLLFRFLELSFPPAMAIALLPTIIPSEYLGLYSVQVFMGALLFMVLSWFYTDHGCKIEN